MDMSRTSRVTGQRSLQQTIQQERPFHSSQHEAYLSILRTAVELSHSTDQFLKQYGVTQAQYNVLRILQGADATGLGRNEIAQRMVTVTPDMTRLLDRLEDAGLVTRRRDRVDKRHTSTTITDAGRKMLKKAEQPLMELHLAQFAGIADAELVPLLRALEQIREHV